MPPDYVFKGVDGNPDKTYDELKSKPHIASWIKLDNNVPMGQSATVVDEGTRNRATEQESRRRPLAIEYAKSIAHARRILRESYP